MAVAAVATAATALVASGIWLGAPDELLSRTYGTALTGDASSRPMHAASINGPGSEQFWLTKDAGANSEGALRILALGDRFTMPEMTAVAGSTTAATATTLEVVDVEEVAHAGRGARMLLITAKAVAAGGVGKEDSRSLVRFVIDLDAVAPHGAKTGRSL